MAFVGSYNKELATASQLTTLTVCNNENSSNYKKNLVSNYKLLESNLCNLSNLKMEKNNLEEDKQIISLAEENIKFLEKTLKYNKKITKFYQITGEELVKEKLNNIRYDWRTKEGLIKDTQIPDSIISKTLEEMSKKGIIYVGVTKNGNLIYTLTENYKKNTKLIMKLKDLLLGRIIR